MKAAARFFFGLFALLTWTGFAVAQVYQSRAEQAILIDVETNSILFQKDAARASPPASLVKVMTAAIVFDAVKSGEIDLDTEFEVSTHAWRTGGAPARGSTMFAELGSKITIADLLRGMIIQSGNDAAIVLAEGLSGSEEAFARRMNRFAAMLKLQDSTFGNPSGLPHEDQRVSPRDFARITQYIIQEHGDLYPIFAELSFTWNGINQSNRNALLSAPIGADGLKTGYTREAGYGLIGSAIQGDRRLVAVLMGLKKESDRALDGRRLLEWGFTAFDHVEIFPENGIVGEVRVFGGDVRRIPVRTGRATTALLPKQNREALDGTIIYDGPVSVPIEEGQEIARVDIFAGDRLVVSAPLFAAGPVSVGSVLDRAISGVGEFLFGWL